MSPEADFLIRAGDTVSVIQQTLEDENGAPVDLTGAQVRFRLAPITGSGTSVLDAAATVVQTGSPPNFTNKGVVKYTWVAGNTAVAGLYLAEWEVTFSGGGVGTYPNGGYVLIRMTEQLA